MKKLVVLFVSVFSISMFVSCNSDDDGGSAPIEGKWAFSKTGIVVDGQEVLIDYEHNELSCGKDYFEFLANGIMNDAYYFLNADDECEVDVEAGTWTRNGNSITIDLGDDVDTATILSLTNSTLKIQYPDGGINRVALFTRL